MVLALKKYEKKYKKKIRVLRAYMRKRDVMSCGALIELVDF
jgi:hypothetical protein